MKVAIINLGCKVNQCECDSIASRFHDMGWEITRQPEAADVYVINTCAVTAEAEKKSRQCVARMRKYNPDARVYVIGCASQKNPAQFANKSVTYIGGTYDKMRVCDLPEGENIAPPCQGYESMPTPLGQHARQVIKIQDGCNNFCSYCIVPYLRGRCRSRSIEDVVAECTLKAPKTAEFVLTGINVSAYGCDLGVNLVDLVRALSVLHGVRFRFGSLEVNVIDNDLLLAMKVAGNFCDHFHLSLQSGDDGVLHDMNRHYTTAQYAEKVEQIRVIFPYAAITTDLIVGFATETDEAFERSLAFARQMAFADIHVFPYSRRQGTKAYALAEIPADVMADRVQRMTQVKQSLHARYLRSCVGNVMQVVTETSDGLFVVGHSANYCKIYVDEKQDCAIGAAYNVRVTGVFRDGLMGERID